MAAPLLDPLPGSEDQKLAAVVGGAALSVATLCCVYRNFGRAPAPATPVPASVAEAVGKSVTPGNTVTPRKTVTPRTGSNSPASPTTLGEDTATRAKERKRPAPVQTGTHSAPVSPRARPSAESIADMLSRRQHVLDEIVAVDEECVRQLEALEKHFVGERNTFLSRVAQ